MNPAAVGSGGSDSSSFEMKKTLLVNLYALSFKKVDVFCLKLMLIKAAN